MHHLDKMKLPTSFAKYWTIFWYFRSIAVSMMLQYRASFIFWLVVSTMWTLFNFFFFHLITRVSGGIGGWNENEITLLIAVFSIIDSLTWSFFYPNMKNYTAAIFSGDVNYWLLKPIDLQFLAMTGTNSLSNAGRLFIGIGVLFWSLNALSLQPAWWQFGLFFLFLVLSMLFIYFWWFILSTMAFWFEKLDSINEMIPIFRVMWQVPRSIYSGLIAFFVTIVIPFGVVTSLPSEILLGKADFGWLVYFAAATFFSVWFSRWFLRFSLKKFSGTAQ